MLESEIARLVEIQLGVERALPSDRLVEDLGAESADLMNLVATVEESFGIAIGEEEGARLGTVGGLAKLVEERLSEGARRR